MWVELSIFALQWGNELLVEDNETPLEGNGLSSSLREQRQILAGFVSTRQPISTHPTESC